jgi:uncharacterized protein YbbC (DUF1343 family)
LKKYRLPQALSAVLILLLGMTMSATAFKPEKLLVQLGNEVFLQDHLDWVKGKRVGLITNPSAWTANWSRSSIASWSILR